MVDSLWLGGDCSTAKPIVYGLRNTNRTSIGFSAAPMPQGPIFRISEDGDSTFWRWYTYPLEHGEPLYLLARSPSRGDEATLVRALHGMHWVR